MDEKSTSFSIKVILKDARGKTGSQIQMKISVKYDDSKYQKALEEKAEEEEEKLDKDTADDESQSILDGESTSASGSQDVSSESTNSNAE